jgi:hypothetical protein
MNANLERKPFSASEFLAGGVALATVALIGLGALRIAPQPSAPAPAGFASVSIPAADAPAGFPHAQPRNSSDAAEAPRDAPSRDARPATGKSTLNDSDGARAPRASAMDRSAAPAAEWPAGQRLRQHGSLVAYADVIWGPPVFKPLRDPRLADSQAREVHAHALPNVRADPAFIGSWTDSAGRCRSGRRPPIAITSRAAKTAYGECDFGLVARQAANRWRVTALCTGDGHFWRANIALKLSEPNLTWSSERGTATYLRCDRRLRSI